MDVNPSPFGEVCGLAARGTEQVGLRRVLFAVTLLVDEEANVLAMRVSPDSPQTEITWDGVSTLVYTATLRSGNTVNASFTAVHTADENSLELCTALTFHPHGWVKFARSTLVLNRYDVFRVNIPLDVVDKSMFRSSVATADIERLYGKSLTAGNGSNGMVSWLKARKALPVPSFTRVVEDGRRKEQRHIEDQLEPAWKERIAMLVTSLLRHPQRTRQIIRRWHAYPMFANKRPCETYALFMETVLTSPRQMRVTQSALHLFRDPALAIPLSWLSTEERIIFTDIVMHRQELFRHVSQTPGQNYNCTGFRLDSLLSKLVCPRFVVHQFAMDCVERATLLGRERPTLLLTLNEAAGACHVRNKRDPFLLFLKLALERRSVIDNVAQMPMYVTIGDAVPVYAYRPPDRSHPQRVPCWTPK